MIGDYFTDVISYPQFLLDKEILPVGTLYQYVSSTFLNGIVNYCQPIQCYVLDRYTHRNSIIELKYCDGKDWHTFCGEKHVAIENFRTGKFKNLNGTISCFYDDVIILGQLSDDLYIYFYFDYDISDCAVGRFETNDNREKIIESIEDYIDACGKNKDISFENFNEGIDIGIIGSTYMPLKFLNNWISF